MVIEKESEIIDDEVVEEGLLRQIELNTPKVRIAISTQDPNETCDYLISRVVKIVDRYD
jgi:hypothetical protein